MMKENGNDVSSIGFVPLVSLCVFIVLFSIGFGPIPWMLIGEIFPAQIKGELDRLQPAQPTHVTRSMT